MSVAVHDPVEYVDRDEAEQARHPRAVVWSAAAATLAVITGPLLAAALGFVERVDPDGVTLSSTAQRVLEEVPGAFETGGLVVVPAATDPGVAWTGIVTLDRVDGAPVDLGVSGLAEYGYLPSSGTAPAWLSGVAPTDRVFSDVGPLSFACMRWPGAEKCTGTLLMEYGADPNIPLKAAPGNRHGGGEIPIPEADHSGLPPVPPGGPSSPTAVPVSSSTPSPSDITTSGRPKLRDHRCHGC